MTDSPPDKQCIEQQFDGAAATYESYRLAPWYQALGQELLDELGPLPQQSTVVDIGCGTGWLLRQIADTSPTVEGIGVDISGGMIATAREKARQRGLGNLTFVKADWENAGIACFETLRAKRPSTIVCASALHYFSDPGNALRAMHDILGPAGRILVLERAREGSRLTAVWDLLHRYFIRDHVRFYRSGELLQFFQEAGFSDADVRRRIRNIFWKNKLFTSVVLVCASKIGEHNR